MLQDEDEDEDEDEHEDQDEDEDGDEDEDEDAGRSWETHLAITRPQRCTWRKSAASVKQQLLHQQSLSSRQTVQSPACGRTRRSLGFSEPGICRRDAAHSPLACLPERCPL